MEGKKFDQDKVRLELVPYTFTKAVAEVLTFGAKKYDAWNWAKGMAWSRLIGAAQRHLGAFQEGEDNDPETGLQHLAHAACCICFLLVYQKLGLGQDDRHVYEKLISSSDIEELQKMGEEWAMSHIQMGG